MIWLLRVVCILIVVSMVCVTMWAGSRVALWEIPSEVGGHPWFIATLFDAYFGFLTFYFWVLYKEVGLLPRALWLLAILLLGNIAMSAYLLIQLFSVSANAPLKQVLLRKPNGKRE